MIPLSVKSVKNVSLLLQSTTWKSTVNAVIRSMWSKYVITVSGLIALACKKKKEKTHNFTYFWTKTNPCWTSWFFTTASFFSVKKLTPFWHLNTVYIVVVVNESIESIIGKSELIWIVTTRRTSDSRELNLNHIMGLPLLNKRKSYLFTLIFGEFVHFFWSITLEL